ncbi:hypothetical protein OZX62_08365 [Bifidobacterium sp. ESL0690]|uniref:hypothetical protein n=1 Tax=Bifidobacterium sp. ESL0690 TaxID=2983214 RepID=UPI0023F7E40D|nr:hypothetical protein [Bifidobacterium sp. ESL0690]WEV46439.1 hypothetical protein OZX62_08365 [Bifidobacterium sp. ESL0690]
MMIPHERRILTLANFQGKFRCGCGVYRARLLDFSLVLGHGVHIASNSSRASEMYDSCNADLDFGQSGADYELRIV